VIPVLYCIKGENKMKGDKIRMQARQAANVSHDNDADGKKEMMKRHACQEDEASNE